MRNKVLNSLLLTAVLIFAFSTAGSCSEFKDWFNKAFASASPNDQIKFYTNAIDKWSSADGDSNKATAFNNRGLAYLNKAKYDDAIKDFVSALDYNPQYSAAYAGLGLCHYRKGLFDKGIEYYSKAIEFNPKFASAYLNRGLIYFDRSQKDLAMADWKKAADFGEREALIKLKKNFKLDYVPNKEAVKPPPGQEVKKSLEDYLFWFKKGFAATDLDEKIDYYTKAIAINQEDASVFYNRGNTYFNKQQYAQALVDYTKAINIGYGEDKEAAAEVYTSRGTCYYFLKKKDQAISDWKYAALYKNQSAVKFLKKYYDIEYGRE